MSNVSLYVVDLARTSPFNGIPVAESVVGFYRCGLATNSILSVYCLSKKIIELCELNQ